MASTYSDRLKLELQGTGENAGTWGDKTNNNLEVLDAFAAWIFIQECRRIG
jgi:hypothetical protein